MKKTKKVNRSIDIVVDVICDCCGKSCKKNISRDGDFNLEYMTLSAKWGYASTHDLESWEAHICNKCVDKKLAKIIDFRKEEYDWATGRTPSEELARNKQMMLNYNARAKSNKKKK